LFPLADTAAMVNLDMVGRMAKDDKTGKGKLIVEGTGTSKSFEELIDKFNKKYDFQLTKRKGAGGYSDHDSFYQKKIPIVFLWTDTHEDYHLPSDTWDKINFTDMARIVDLAEEVVTYLATEEQRPEYVYVPPQYSAGPISIPKLGITPASYSGTNGVKVSAVHPNGPADKGGMKDGDVIIAINNRNVTTMGTYMAIMTDQKAGQALTITVLRGKEKVTLTVTPK
jgi:C-terminal processing protease CtpA/Prc